MRAEEGPFFFKCSINNGNDEEKEELSAVLEAYCGGNREAGGKKGEKTVKEKRPEKRGEKRPLFFMDEEGNPAEEGKEYKNLAHGDGDHRE